jgi:hypothetical protein
LLVATAARSDVPVSDEARQLFRTGVSLLEDPEGARYEEAYAAFKAAYEKSPSPKILGNLGLCAMKLERDSEAIDAYTRYLAEVTDIAPEERAQIERDLGILKTNVVPVQIVVEPLGATIYDERRPVSGPPIVNRYGPVRGPLGIGVRPGAHVVRVELAGHTAASWRFDGVPGQRQEKAFTLAPAGPAPVATPTTPAAPAEPERPIPAGVWVGLAATGAFAVGATITGVLALGKNSDYEDEISKPKPGIDPAKAEDLRDAGQTLNIVTDVLIGGAIVSAGVTVILFFTRPEVEAGASAGLRVVPVVTPRGGALAATASF